MINYWESKEREEVWDEAEDSSKDLGERSYHKWNSVAHTRHIVGTQLLPSTGRQKEIAAVSLKCSPSHFLQLLPIFFKWPGWMLRHKVGSKTSLLDISVSDRL